MAGNGRRRGRWTGSSSSMWSGSSVTTCSHQPGHGHAGPSGRQVALRGRRVSTTQAGPAPCRGWRAAGVSTPGGGARAGEATPVPGAPGPRRHDEHPAGGQQLGAADGEPGRARRRRGRRRRWRRPGRQLQHGRTVRCAMRAVVQRVTSASVDVGGEVVGAIGPGLLALVGVTHDDGAGRGGEAGRQARPPPRARRRRRRDEPLGARHRRAVLVVSQFTLYGDTSGGRRPSWIAAARPELAEPLVARSSTELRRLGVEVATGRFRTEMAVALVNDGPVTVIARGVNGSQAGGAVARWSVRRSTKRAGSSEDCLARAERQGRGTRPLDRGRRPRRRRPRSSSCRRAASGSRSRRRRSGRDRSWTQPS